MGKTKLLLDIIHDLHALADRMQTVADAISAEELEKIRRVLAQKSLAGFTAEVRSLLEKHGAPKLSQIKPEEYPALLAEAKALE